MAEIEKGNKMEKQILGMSGRFYWPTHNSCCKQFPPFESQRNSFEAISETLCTVFDEDATLGFLFSKQMADDAFLNGCLHSCFVGKNISGKQK